MMMIQAQAIGMCASRLPQTRTCILSPVSQTNSSWRRRWGLQWSSGFPMGRADSTWANKQASSCFSSAGDQASHDEVPAKNTGTGVRDGTGTQTVELISTAAGLDFASAVDDPLPPLSSMLIDGLPPLRQSKFTQEAEKHLHQYAARYPEATSLYYYCRVGLATANYVHSGVISLDRIVAISINYGLLYVLDDLFFDKPEESLHHQYGTSCDACESPRKIQENLDHLDAIFGQQVQPRPGAPLIETLLWELGQDMLELSNPDWFQKYIACVVDSHRTNIGSLAEIFQGPKLGFEGLESYTAMRAANCGGYYAQMLIEFANNAYLPNTLRMTPYFGKVTTVAALHPGFVNDIFSYHMESSLEGNPRNLLTVLMECEGKTLVQAVHAAIGLVNAYARVLLELEAEAWNPTLRNHLQDVKAFIAGIFYFHCLEKRYRHPEGVFPELRDMSGGSEVLQAQGLEL